MTRIGRALVATLAISLAAWTFFRFTMPDVPLTEAETSFIVFVTLCAVLARGWLRTQVVRAWCGLRRGVAALARLCRVGWTRILARWRARW